MKGFLQWILQENLKKKNYLEYQTLGRWDDSPINPVTNYIEDCQNLCDTAWVRFGSIHWTKKNPLCNCTLYETNVSSIKTFPRVETSIYCWSFQKLKCWCNCVCGFFFIRMAIKQPKNRDKVIVKRDLFTYENYFLDFY